MDIKCKNSCALTGRVVVTKIVRTSKRSTKSSVGQVHSLLSVKDSPVPEPEEEESSPGEHSFIYSPSRRRTRGELLIHLPVPPSIHPSIHDGFNPVLCLCFSFKSRVSWPERRVCSARHSQQEKSCQRCLCCSSCKKFCL